MNTRTWFCRMGAAAFCLCLSGSLTLAGESGHGVMKSLETASFEQDQDVKCLQSSLASGDPSTGPSTFLLKAAPGCLVPWHFHTAAEQLIVVRGTVATEMQGMHAESLLSGGYAMMPGKVAHQFTCKGNHPCWMYVMFDQKYDIFWGKGP